jgi:hypothetical protein
MHSPRQQGALLVLHVLTHCEHQLTQQQLELRVSRVHAVEAVHRLLRQAVLGDLPVGDLVTVREPTARGGLKELLLGGGVLHQLNDDLIHHRATLLRACRTYGGSRERGAAG